jgi:hypothetical protein
MNRRGLGQVPTNVQPGISSGLPTSGGLWWWNYAWIYVPASGLPPDPISGNITPPGQPQYSNELGSWVEGNGFFLWFPAGMQGSPYGQIQGGDGVLYDIYASSGASSSDMAAGQGSSFPAPATFTPSPFDSTAPAGEWINTYPDYWAWVSSPADIVGSALGTTSTGGIIALLVIGVLVVGGVTYLVYEGSTTS